MTRTANALVLVLLGALLLVGFLLMLLPSGASSSSRSVRSTDSDGRRALYLVLEELGYQTRSWTESPGNLPRAGHVIYLPDTPEAPPGYARAEPDPAPGTQPGSSVVASSRRLRDPLHYQRFVEEGGTLVTPITGDIHFTFLTDTFGLESLADLTLVWKDEEEKSETTRALLASGEELELEWGPSATFEPLPVSSPLETLALDEEGKGLAYALSVGRGSVVLLAPDDGWMNNARLAGGDNALFFVRLIERRAKTRRILFDEYSLGGWVPESPLALAFAPSTFAFSLHLLLWGLFALWMVVWTRPFARDPEPWSQVSAIARAQGFAGMIAGAGRWNLLARMLRAGVMRRLSARVGRRPVRERETETEGVPLELDAEEVKRVLELVLHGVEPEAIEQAHTLLTSARVGDAEELERLGERLAQLERMVLVSERR